MQKPLSTFSKLFGSGPAGVVVSLILLFIAIWLNKLLAPPPLIANHALRLGIFLASCVLAVVIIVWSVKSLPALDRGNKLCTSGAFKYFRHPLYAAFLLVFDFGLAIYLNSYIYILWAIALHPVWHWAIGYEERLMIGIFGQDYIDYAGKTGRFFPRLIKTK